MGWETTRFILDYTKESRVLGVENVCEKIGSDDIEDLPDAALITPIIGELTKNAVEAIQSEVLALDPQGCARSTGAGDVFLGSFMSEYLRGEDPIWCACVGSAMASLVVETLGARIDSSNRDAFHRAEELLECVVRV